MPDAGTSDGLLGSTARWTAAVRAMESRREDRLFNDPWAAALAGQAGLDWIEGRTIDAVTPIILRTRYFDDFLQRIAQQHNVRQVVLMAAGLDTRGFRLDWPAKTQLFELDQALVLEHKEQVLRSVGATPSCERRTIAVDLTGPWSERLVAAGFHPQQPSVWLLEGFLFYLPSENITQILDGVSGIAAAGSWLGFDIVNSVTLTSPWTRRWIEMQASLGAPWIGTMDRPEEFLARRGWLASLTQAGEPGTNYGRWPFPVLGTTNPEVPHNWFVTACKGETASVP